MTLSLVWMLVALLITVGAFHAHTVTRRFRTMCWIFGIGLLGLLMSCALMPPRLFGMEYAGGAPLADAVLAIYFYGFWFFGVFVQLYGLADRGFSLAILTDCSRAGAQPMSRQAIKHHYAGGRGMAFVREKRIQQIVHGGLIRHAEGVYSVTPLGAAVGRIFWRLKRLYGFQETG